MSGGIATLPECLDHVARVEVDAPAFWVRHKVRAMGRLSGGYQFGYEIQGYGTVVGHCTQHEPHKTEASAAECGRRFLAGEPPRLVDRMPWRRARKGR